MKRMLELNVIRAEWILLSLVGGTMVTFLLLIGYLDLWLPRHDKFTGPAWMKTFKHFPWVLIVTIVGGVTFMFVYLAVKIISPPHW